MRKNALTASIIANMVVGDHIKPIIPDVSGIESIIAAKERTDKIRESIAKITNKDKFFIKHR